MSGHQRSLSDSSMGSAPMATIHWNTITQERQPLEKFAVGIDIGGTLTKICYFEKQPRDDDSEEDTRLREAVRLLTSAEATYGETGQRDTEFEFTSDALQGKFHFFCFETRKMETFLNMVKEEGILDYDILLCCTGGGARKYSSYIHEHLKRSLPRTDELQCLIDGVCLMLHEPVSQLYHIDTRTFTTTQERIYLPNDKDIYPFILVNIGSGVSILKVSDDGTHVRIGGSALGGATFFGLCSMLTGCESYDEALQLASQGSSSHVDLLVGDIYGGDYDEYNLSAKTVAASMGKLVRPKDRAQVAHADMARGLLDCVTNNIGSIALLHARQHNIENVVFAGNFFRRNSISQVRLSAAFNFWAKETTPLFFRHEGYLGALGALVYGYYHRT